MENSSDENTLKLINWLHTLVEIIRSHDTPTWELLVHTVNNKSAIIGIDSTYLSLSAKGGLKLNIEILPYKQINNPDFHVTSNTIVNIIVGRYTIDKAINDGHIFIRSQLADLLNIHYLLMNVLADTPINQDFLTLWLDFKDNWQIKESYKTYYIEDQTPSFGFFIKPIPILKII